MLTERLKSLRNLCAKTRPLVRGALPEVGFGAFKTRGYANLIAGLLALFAFIFLIVVFMVWLGFEGWGCVFLILAVSASVAFLVRSFFVKACNQHRARVVFVFKKLRLPPPVDVVLRLEALNRVWEALPDTATWRAAVLRGAAPLRCYVGRSTGILATHWHGAGLEPDQSVTLPMSALTRNLLVLGGIGSGKTTGVMLPLLLQLLDQDAGGLLFDLKGDMKIPANTFAAQTGRPITWIGPDHEQLNLLSGLTPEVAASFLKSAFFLNGGGSSDGFWVDTATELCRNTLGLLSFLPAHYSLHDLYSYLFEAEHREVIDGKLFAVKSTLSEKPSRLLQCYLHYYSSVFQHFDAKVKSGVRATIAQVLSPFNHPDLIDAFCVAGGSMLPMESVLSGAILAVDLPLSHWGMGAKVVYTMIKLRFFNVMQARHRHLEWNQNRPVFFFCDEYQEIVSANPDGLSDINFWDKSRSSKTLGIISAQSVSSFYAAVGRRDLVHALLQNFRQKLCFRTEDPETIEFMQKIVGPATVKRVTQHDQGQSITEVREWVITAQLFRKFTEHQALAILSMGGLSWDDVLEMQLIYLQDAASASERVMPPDAVSLDRMSDLEAPRVIERVE